MSSSTSVESLLSRIRDWWSRQNELSGLDAMELERVAKEMGMSASDLENLVARGPDAASFTNACKLWACPEQRSSTTPWMCCAIFSAPARVAMKRADARGTCRSARMTGSGTTTVPMR